jgi:thiamine biosynthesis protein ThiS
METGTSPVRDATFSHSIKSAYIVLYIMKLQINGEEITFDPPVPTLAALVETLGMKSDRVAIELNRDIVPRDRWAETILKDGDKLEMVHFVGGGSLRADAISPRS